MSAEATADQINPVPPAPPQTEPEYVFPVVGQKGALAHIDGKTGTFWVGISMMHMPYEAAALYLDARKFDLHVQYKRIEIALQQQAETSRLGDLRGKQKEGLSGLIGRLSARGGR
jgi:hypothetical protein